MGIIRTPPRMRWAGCYLTGTKMAVAIEQKMLKETGDDETVTARWRRRWPTVLALYPRLFARSTGESNSLLRIPARAAGLDPRKPRPRRPPVQELRANYERVAHRLNAQFSEARERTESERRFTAAIRKHARLKFSTSVWIGTVNVDILFVNLGAEEGDGRDRRGQGIVVEIDGSIHDNPVKMKKDERKGLILHGLGILATSVPNADLNHPRVRAVVEHLKDIPRLDSRGRSRVWKRIYLATLASHLSDDEFNHLFFERPASGTEPLAAPAEGRAS